MTSNLGVEIAFSDAIDESHHESGDDDVPESSMLQRWAQSAYLKPDPAIVSLYIADSDEIQQMNKEYRDKDKPTNVLSFPMPSADQWPELATDTSADTFSDIAAEPASASIRLLGDIALCAEVIAHEAAEQGKSAHAHWAHMVVHGMLHLQGYDHIDDDQAEQMEQLEIEILQTLAIANPYLAGTTPQTQAGKPVPANPKGREINHE